MSNRISRSLLKEWDYEKNEISPKDKTSGSKYKAWWKCPKCGQSYQATIQNRSRGSGCPYCAGQKILKGFNDLATLHPELLKEWDYEKNTILPTEIGAGSQQKVWWVCSKCGKSWTTRVVNRTRRHCNCPNCSTRRKRKVGRYDMDGTLLEQYDSIREASQAMPIDASCISMACHGKTKQCCGFIWKFLDV